MVGRESKRETKQGGRVNKNGCGVGIVHGITTMHGSCRVAHSILRAWVPKNHHNCASIKNTISPSAMGGLGPSNGYGLIPLRVVSFLWASLAVVFGVIKKSWEKLLASLSECGVKSFPCTSTRRPLASSAMAAMSYRT